MTYFAAKNNKEKAFARRSRGFLPGADSSPEGLNADEE